MENKYYDGTKLLSLLDANGNKPEIYISTSNRSAGKTTYFSRWFVKRFIEHGEKFILMYRYNYELVDVANKFFAEIGRLFFPKMTFESVPCNKNVYCELFLNEQPCGYAIAINNSDQVKKLSHLFADAQRILFDEFQSETGKYCANEIEKFLSIHTSIARGNGEQVRYLPVYMLGNFVSVINPYYLALNVAHKIQENTRYLRGDGFVIEQGFLQNVADAQKSSAFNRAFAGHKYTKFASEKIYLNDNNTFVQKMSGPNTYVCTVKYGGEYFGIRRYHGTGLIYCSRSYDESYPLKICTSAEDHEPEFRLLGRSDFVISSLRAYFDDGLVRFQDLKCKEVVFKILSYSYK